MRFIDKEDEITTGNGHTVLMSQLHILPSTAHFTGIILHFVWLLWSASGKIKNKIKKKKTMTWFKVVEHGS